MSLRTLALSAALSALAATTALAETFAIKGSNGTTLKAEVIAPFENPWAMTFLPDGTMLVTDQAGTMFHVTQDGKKTEVEGMWRVAYGGQGGLGDVVLHPDFDQNSRIYVSFAETLDKGSTFGAAVVSAKLDTSSDKPKLTDLQKIWTQEPKMAGQGHYSHRIAFGPKGSEHEGKMFITSGDRQKQYPAQEWNMALGKLIRLNLDGSVPDDNPWQDKGELAKTFWSTGHRNALGIAFAPDGKLWTHEMGPKHGDEVNLIEKGSNYGWPIVSNGDNYSGVPIPDHSTRPEFNAPEASWTPTIAPSGLVIYSGEAFPEWKGDAFIGGLRSRAIIHVDIEGETASEKERFSWGKRVRELEQGPNGALWVLEDNGRLLKITAGEAS